MEEAEALSDRIAIMRDGQLLLCDTAEKIKELGLTGAVAAVPLYSPEEESLRNRATEYIQGFNSLLENMKTHLDSIAALCSVKTSIFSGGISETERKTILDGAGDLISRINRLGEKGLDLVGEMFRTNERLQEIQSLYNNSLYSLGLLNVGAGVLGIEAEGIYDVIETAFDKFNDTTAFVNDLNDRTIIFEEAIELKLNPLLSELLDDIDGVLIMSVNPGYAGQKMIPRAIEKIRELRAYLDAHGRADAEIEVDGNVSIENAIKMREAGASIFVLGSAMQADKTRGFTAADFAAFRSKALGE
jgi:hypothetical protein